MPIPIIVWVAGLLYTAYHTDTISEKLAKFLNSDDGQKLVKDLNEVVNSEKAPYEKIFKDAYYTETDMRRITFIAIKQKMTSSKWTVLMSVGNDITKTDIKYLSVMADLNFANTYDE